MHALQTYGCPEEVSTDNGKQFTGRFTRPHPVEVLFERICRRNAIHTILTKPRSPTTTGKAERFHQTLQRDCLDVHGPFDNVAAAQKAVDEFRAAQAELLRETVEPQCQRSWRGGHGSDPSGAGENKKKVTSSTLQSRAENCSSWRELCAASNATVWESSATRRC